METAIISKTGKKTRASYSVYQDKGYFVCEKSKEPVFLKKPKLRSDHFCHYPKSSCKCDIVNEVETPEHSFMKNWVQNTLGLTDEAIECWIGDLRTDAFFEDGGLSFAIECQFCAISVDKMEKKNRAYLAQNVFPIWIFYSKERFLKNIEKLTEIGQISFYMNGPTNLTESVDTRLCFEVVSKGIFIPKLLNENYSIPRIIEFIKINSEEGKKLRVALFDNFGNRKEYKESNLCLGCDYCKFITRWDSEKVFGFCRKYENMTQIMPTEKGRKCFLLGEKKR